MTLKEGVTRRLKEFARPWLALSRAQSEFQKNLSEWAKGGPGPRGWTRTGPSLQTPECRLVWIRRRLLEIDDCFAKNRAETARWHLAFLKTYLSGGDLHNTAYWLEYLVPRFSREVAEQKSARFVALYESIASGGYRPRSHVWVADLGSAPGLESYFGFRYFRFDGCHRLACLHTLGISTVSCSVFSVRCNSAVLASSRQYAVNPSPHRGSTPG
jgi:hypothetical protein